MIKLDRATALNTIVFAAATVAAGTQPVLIGLYAERLALSVRESAWLASAEQLGMGLGAVVAIPLLSLAPPRRLLWTATVLVVAATVASAFADAYGVLLAARLPFAAGFGLAYAVASYGLARAYDPSRAFALAYSLQILFCAGYAYAAPRIATAGGYVPAVLTLAGWAAFIGGAAFLTAAARRRPRQEARATAGSLSWLRRTPRQAWPRLAAVVLFGAGNVTLWSTAEPIARGMGADGSVLGLAVSLGSLGGFAAGVAAGVWGRRVALPTGVAVTVATTFASLLWFALGATAAHYVLAMVVFNVGYTLGGVYLNAIAVLDDQAGGAARLLPAAHLLAGVLGGLIAGVASAFGLTAVMATAMALCLSSLVGLSGWRPGRPKLDVPRTSVRGEQPSSTAETA